MQKGGLHRLPIPRDQERIIAFHQQFHGAAVGGVHEAEPRVAVRRQGDARPEPVVEGEPVAEPPLAHHGLDVAEFPLDRAVACEFPVIQHQNLIRQRRGQFRLLDDEDGLEAHVAQAGLVGNGGQPEGSRIRRREDAIHRLVCTRRHVDRHQLCRSAYAEEMEPDFTLEIIDEAELHLLPLPGADDGGTRRIAEEPGIGLAGTALEQAEPCRPGADLGEAIGRLRLGKGWHDARRECRCASQ